MSAYGTCTTEPQYNPPAINFALKLASLHGNLLAATEFQL